MGRGVLGWTRTRRFPDHKLGFDANLPGNVTAIQTLQKGLSGNLGHLPPRLPNRCQARILVCGAIYIVKADDGNIFGHAKAGLTQRTHSADGREIVD